MLADAPIVLAAPAVAPVTIRQLAGEYRLSQMEMGGGLLLLADGTYRYMLDYGAVSEASEGRWTTDGRVVQLVGTPIAAERLYEMERSDAGFAGQTLTIDGDTLVMERYDARMFFRRTKP